MYMLVRGCHVPQVNLNDELAIISLTFKMYLCGP